MYAFFIEMIGATVIWLLLNSTALVHFVYGTTDSTLLYFFWLFFAEKILDYGFLKGKTMKLMKFLGQCGQKLLFYTLFLMIANGFDTFLHVQVVRHSLLLALFIQEAFQVLTIATLAGYQKEVSLLKEMITKFLKHEGKAKKESEEAK